MEKINQRNIVLKGDGDIESFIEQVYAASSSGNTVTISLYGYNATVYPYSSKNSLRLGIIKKLHAIKNMEQNIFALTNYTDLSVEEIAKLSSQNPEHIADLCLEYGVIGTTQIDSSKKIG